MDLSMRLLRIPVWVGVLLAAGVLSAKTPDLVQAQAQILDHAEFLCDNCFFGASDYFFCFAADNKILVAYQKTPVLNWEDPSKNYLAKVYHTWAPWANPGATVPISYDDKYIWVYRANGKKVKLHRSSVRDIFTNNAQCRQAEGAKVP
jgi:hypothetical protein